MLRLWELFLPVVEQFLKSDLRDSVNYYSSSEFPDMPKGKVVEVTIRFVSEAKHSNRAES